MKLKKEDKLELYKEESKFFVDVAKLVFAGTILSGIMKEDINFCGYKWQLSCSVWIASGCILHVHAK